MIGRRESPLSDSIIYEMHVRGFSMLNEHIRQDLRGTYAGLASPPALKYLKKLGITAVELMPVHQFIHDKVLVDRGLRNYWGYNTLNYFSPESEYSSSGDIGRAGPGIQGDGEGPAPRRHRGHPRRGLQPHRRRQSARPHAQLPRHRQSHVLQARARQSALLHGLHRDRQQPERAPSAGAEADHGQPALLGHGDARRRLPLRSGRQLWRASCTMSTGSPPSSTSFIRTRSSRR